MKVKKTAREIIISENLITNKNINVKIGTAENRSCPETVYIYVSFWIKPEKKIALSSVEQEKRRIIKCLRNIHDLKIIKKMKRSKIFCDVKENIYIVNVPENFCCNDRPNFISLELYLHTINIKNKEIKISLNNKKDTEMFDEAIKVANIIGDNLRFGGGKKYTIQKRSKGVYYPFKKGMNWPSLITKNI